MKVLDLEMQANDADAKTIKDYLKALLTAVWSDGESFSGKRPFGNSGWDCELQLPLVKAGLVKGRIDTDGYLEDCDEAAAHQIIQQAIEAL